MRRALFPRLVRDQRGATIIEFAFVAPIMSLVLLAGFDFAHTLYTRGALQGIMQKAARDSALESGTTNATTIDDEVRAQASALVNNATITIKRRYYRTFSKAAAAQAEAWTDTNLDGACDAGEPYQDENLNNVWDPDGADAGQGGAKDAVVYTVTMTYPHMFPLYNFIGSSHNATVTAATVLRNQPFGDQSSYGTPVVRNCT